MHEIVQTFDVHYDYPVLFTRSAFDPDNLTLREVLLRAGDGTRRVLPVLDSGLLQADPDLPRRIRDYAETHRDVLELIEPHLVVRGGEICKSDPTEVWEFYSLVERHRICRHSTVLAIGGGSVLDAVGFAAATAHRGLRLIRMPSTVLAQDDAGIGVKNAVNFHGRKNFLGVFAPPVAVVNDLELLTTLPARDLRSGMAEAVKVSLIRDPEFFEQLWRGRTHLAAFESAAMEALITRCAEIHLAHIRGCGDPFEMGSARPLDFGHWSAHKLEELSRGELRHGEAVAMGIAIDAHYSHDVGMIGEEDLHRVLRLLADLGFDLQHPLLARLDIETALADFREHLGGELCITLLEGIGRGVEVREIDLEIMRKCVGLLHRGT